MGKGKKNSVTKMKKMEEKFQNQRKITRKQNIIKEEEDRISALEDCLLLEIISRLPSTKEAIRTGSLSKRWQHLWTEVPTLIFQYHNTTYSPWNLFQFIENPEAEFKFFSFVEQTLIQCRQLKLKTFELITSYNIGFRSQVNDWIRYAIKCNVEELNLILWNKRLEVKFELDQLFFTRSSFTHLNLEGCILNPTGAVTWNNLVSLCLVRQELDEGLIENMLSGSPLLETLILYRCYGYTRLDITSKSVKSLALDGYGSDYVAANDGSYVVKINAPTILSLKINGRFSLSKILLLNVSSVVEAELDFTKDGKFSTRFEEEEETLGFVKRLCHVKELGIGSVSLKTLASLEDKGFNVPSNIKYIYSDDDSDSNGD